MVVWEGDYMGSFQFGEERYVGVFMLRSVGQGYLCFIGVFIEVDVLYLEEGELLYFYLGSGGTQ